MDVDMRLMWRGLTWQRRRVMVEINVFWWILMRCAVDVAGVDMAASTCCGRNQRVLVDLDATWRIVDVVCGVWWMWLASMWHVVG